MVSTPSQIVIENGFIYQLDYTNRSALTFCAKHIGCASGCSGDADTDSGDSMAAREAVVAVAGVAAAIESGLLKKAILTCYSSS